VLPARHDPEIVEMQSASPAPNEARRDPGNGFRAAIRARIGVWRVGLCAALATLIAFADVAAAQNRGAVIVASKLDTEGALLGQMMILALERAGVPVEGRLQLGPTQLVRDALLKGVIDIYPEYTGNGALFHGIGDDPVWRSPASAYEAARRLDAERHQLVWLPPAPANNAWAIAVRGDVARRERLVTMDDFAEIAARPGAIKLAGSEEFVDSPAALPAFERTYGFVLPREEILVLPGGDTSATLRAAAQGRNGVNAAMAYGTDGAIAALDLEVMTDPKGAQIVYEPAPVLRAEVLQRHAAIGPALSRVFSSLSLDRLQALNAQITVEGRSPREVAERYLKQEGLLR
jgi:osmoprotectant transport system substrate-binding protein